MNETLTFNNGTVLHDSYAIPVDAVLYIYIRDPECTFESAFELLNDRNATAKIICERYGEKQTFSKYIDFYTITKDATQISAGIRYAE